MAIAMICFRGRFLPGDFRLFARVSSLMFFDTALRIAFFVLRRAFLSGISALLS
jgi:hypothetical protein